jgi:hypothetical protein
VLSSACDILTRHTYVSAEIEMGIQMSFHDMKPTILSTCVSSCEECEKSRRAIAMRNITFWLWLM